MRIVGIGRNVEFRAEDPDVEFVGMDAERPFGVFRHFKVYLSAYRDIPGRSGKFARKFELRAGIEPHFRPICQRKGSSLAVRNNEFVVVLSG